MSVYLHLYHGRDTRDEEMNGWGFDGPVIGPLDYVHTTYGDTVTVGGAPEVIEQFFGERESEFTIEVRGGLFSVGGKFYGDWTVYSNAEGE
jgi:hypothetical protein